MADSVSVDRVVLRTGIREEVAEYLKHIRSATTNPAAVTSQLHDAVVQGSIPHGIFSIWMPIANDAQSIIQALRQPDSRSERHVAIRAFIKAMRSPKTMDLVWNAAGGAAGVAATMNNLSVDEIKVLCNGLAKTASLPRGRLERHDRLTELISILGADASQSKDNPDTRPLLRYYKRILPACSTKRVAEHEETGPKWTDRQPSILLRAHPAFYETKFLETIFSNKDSKKMEIDEDKWTNLINNNFGFGKTLLLKFLENGDELPVTPDAFMHTLAQPLTRRLRRRRPAAEQDLPFEVLELLVRLVYRHSALADILSESLTGVIFYVVKFWEKTRSRRPQVEQHLIELIKLAPDTRFRSADKIVSFLRAVSPAISFRLFQLLIQNLKYYGFDIDCISNETEGLFQKLKGPWPASLFTTTFGMEDRQASFRLFQRLMALLPDGSFLLPANEAEISILDHCNDPESNRGDSEVLQILLMRTSPTSSGQGQDVAGMVGIWLQERKKKASSSRDWESRAFWAISALNMSVASGSLDVYAETLLWARRFNKGSNTVKEIYASGHFQTVEGRKLLSGISQTAYATSQDFDAAEEIRSANKIMLQLLETASMALREPSFQRWDWDTVIALPVLVVEQRFRMVNDFQDARKLTDAKIFYIVWQPSLELLLEAEKSLLRPGLQRLYPRDLGGLLNAMDCPRNFDVREPASKNPGLFDEVAWDSSIEVPIDGYGQFWDLSSLNWPISGKGTDAIIASLLLTLNTVVGSDNSILKQPFPSEVDARYPALYLDQDFLETVDQDYFGFNNLRINHVIRSGPPELLAQVVKSVLLKVELIEKFEPQEHPQIHPAMTLTKLLANGDRPSLAFPFVRDVIINRPSHSSWHRELLNKAFFNTLPPIEAKSLLDIISDGIHEKLDEQSARAKEAREQSSDLVSRSAPIVKVTTVKMLVKLLSDALFLSVASALEILVGLLAKAQPIDIRVAIIETLFDNLEDETASSQVKVKIISLLEKLAVPLAASLNELRPTTEADWDDAEAGGQLPEVASRREQPAAPIRYLFFHLDKRLCNDLDTKRRLAEMTVRLVEQSAENNKRWTNLFLKKYGFSLPPEETVSLSPLDPDMLKIFSKSPEYFNRSTFEMLRALVLANIQPPPGIAAITTKVRRDSVLTGSNAGKHWLSLYGRGKFTMSRYGCTDCLAVMHQNIISREIFEPSDRIPLDMLQQFAHEIAHGLISSGDSSYIVALFKRMTSAMVDEKSIEALHQWKATTLPVLQNILTHIMKLRTPAWQLDPKRRPSELPSTFHLKVAMLAIPPGLGFEQTFVDDVMVLIKELSENTAPYHENWEHLKYQVLHYHADWRPRLAHLALLFGSLENVDVEHPTLVDHLRVGMAKQLAERAYDPKDKEVVVRFKQMLRSWTDCPVEEFRHSARETLNKLQGGFEKEWFNTGEVQEWMDLDSDETSSVNV
ncbi:hypothetical protein CI238_10501 [Colletotrichum incanum]|uniref:Uncharacterized protein n=1 Tax=Colletotrichum incanum TaxID=1573173 RepID=A0A166LCJ1_COLIC|nr:hypothetical protein CI238_10501 [Colletotrichum incanum]